MRKFALVGGLLLLGIVGTAYVRAQDPSEENRTNTMMFSAEPISEFVSRHPTIKVLALSFLLLIGVSLVGDGLDLHVPKGYIYFAMGFSVFVELINLRVRGSASPVRLRQPFEATEPPGRSKSTS